MNKFFTTVLCIVVIIFASMIKFSPVIYYKQGQKFYKTQQYVKAYKNFKNAYKLDKKNKDYKYFYVLSLNKLQPTLKIQKEVFEIASDSEKDSAQQAAESIIASWRNNILLNIGETYIEQAPMNNQIIRWNKFPLKVAILTDNSVPSYYKESIRKALEQWQTSTQFIKFNEVQKEKDANIVIKIAPITKDVCKDNGCKYVVGYTTPNYRNSHLKKMTIILYSTDPKGSFFSDKEVYNTTVHELGHALGIMGHSYSLGDLMYMSGFYTPDNTSFQYLSAKDINTIKLLYKLIPDITDNPKFDTKELVYAPIVLGTSEEISKKKLKEAENYIKNAPNLAGGYVDLGIAYAELGRNKEAINAMEKAYKLAKSDDEKFITLFNLASFYLEKKEYNKALEYAQRAKSIFDNEEINELIININHNKIK